MFSSPEINYTYKNKVFMLLEHIQEFQLILTVFSLIEKMSASRETGNDPPGESVGPGNDPPGDSVGPQSPVRKDDMSPGTKRKNRTQRPKVPPKSPIVRAKSVSAQKSDASSNAGSVAPPLVPPRINAPNTSIQSLPPSRKRPIPIPRVYEVLEPSEPTSPTPPKKEVVVEVTTVEGLAKRPNDLPIMARFIDGYYGKTTRFSVSSGDKFQFHFVKQTKVLSVQDQFGAGYAVPMSSASKFGLLYDQSKMPSAANFKAVSDLLLLKNLPHVICAQKCVHGKNRKVEVDEGDVLVVKEKHKKELRCYNLRTSSDVALNKHCEGHFTLDPEKTRMFPMDIVNHLPNVFPIKARMYMPTTETGSTKSKQRKIFTLLGSTIEVSLIGRSDQQEYDDLVDIPLDKNLSKLRIEILASDNMPHLYEDAQAVAKSFDPSKCIAFRDVGSDAGFDLQSALIKEVRPEEKYLGVQLCTSEYVHMQAFRCKAQKEERPAYATLDIVKTSDMINEDTNQEYSTIDDFLNGSEMARQSQQPETMKRPVETQQKQVSLSPSTTPAASIVPSGKHAGTSTGHSLSSSPRGVIAFPPTQGAPDNPEHEYMTISDFYSPNETTDSVAPQLTTALEQEKKSVTETNRQFLTTMDVPHVSVLLVSDYKLCTSSRPCFSSIFMPISSINTGTRST